MRTRVLDDSEGGRDGGGPVEHLQGNVYVIPRQPATENLEPSCPVLGISMLVLFAASVICLHVLPAQ